MEPLFYYNAYHTDTVCGPSGINCKNGEMPWIGTDYKFTDDFKSVTVNLRKGVEWSDGQPFTAKDVVFTVQMLIDNAPKLGWSADMKQWVKSVSAPDDNTVQFTLTDANPRFIFSYFTFHQDVGVFVVPEHVFKGQNAQTFTNFDLAKGWPVVTGPYKMVYSDSQQKIWDRRDDWWGTKTGFHPLPAPERMIFLPGYDESKQVELLINNEADCALSMQLGNIKAAMDRNPKIASWSGKDPPFGYVDWWPTGLGFNDTKEPYNDPDIRHAINNVLNRDEIVKNLELGFRACSGTIAANDEFLAKMGKQPSPEQAATVVRVLRRIWMRAIRENLAVVGAVGSEIRRWLKKTSYRDLRMVACRLLFTELRRAPKAQAVTRLTIRKRIKFFPLLGMPFERCYRAITGRSSVAFEIRRRLNRLPDDAIVLQIGSNDGVSGRTRRSTIPIEPRCRNTLQRKRPTPGREWAKSASEVDSRAESAAVQHCCCSCASRFRRSSPPRRTRPFRTAAE